MRLLCTYRIDKLLHYYGIIGGLRLDEFVKIAIFLGNILSINFFFYFDIFEIVREFHDCN